MIKAIASFSIVSAAILLTACTDSKKERTAQREQAAAEAKQDTPVVPASQIENKNMIVEIETSMGTMKARLYDETPLHRDNFVKLANEGYFNDLLFHRVIQGFMIQGGDPNSKGAAPGAALGNGGPGYTVPAEFNPALFHKKGALSAARMGDQVNPKKASSGSQFYIVQGKVIPENQLQQYSRNSGIQYTPAQVAAYATVGGTPMLDGGYTVFGEVFEGLEVIDKIAAVQTQNERPVTDVKMKIRVVKK